MELENAYYKKIIYKKNAFEEVKTYIKLNYNNKNIMLVSTKSVEAEDVTSLLNALFCGSENVYHFVSRNSFVKAELDCINDKLSKGDFDLLVALGGGKCADTVKFFANHYGLPFIVCPTVATSLAYFTNFCVNPYDSTKSFYADYPKRVFIQEQIVRKTNPSINIQGLCLLHSLRSVYVEGMIDDEDAEKYVFVGLEKVFSKLDEEQTNILLCGEDSNLVLMDLLIDFGFFVGLLNREKYYLITTFLLLEKMDHNSNFAGKKMLLCAKSILLIFKRFIEINTVKTLEKVDFCNIAGAIANCQISSKTIKNNKYFIKNTRKIHKKCKFLKNREYYYKIISFQLLKIKDFIKQLKSIYKNELSLEQDLNNVFRALAISPFLNCDNLVVDMVAGSGVLNSFLV